MVYSLTSERVTDIIINVESDYSKTKDSQATFFAGGPRLKQYEALIWK